MPFAKYKNTPFLRYIVPIIPVGAKLAEGCKIKPENLGKIPGVRNPNGTWSGFGNFNRHISTNAIMDAFAAFYKHEGYTETVGILGREFICFDADTEYEAAIDIMRRNALFWLGETYERTRSNSKKFALIYRRRPNTPPIKKRRVSFAHALYQDDVQALEILGDGQQWLMEGKHKSGVLYEWKDGVRPWEMDVDKIPEIDNAQLDACLKAISAELALHFLLNPRAAAAANAPGMGQTTADRSPIGPEHPDRVEDLSLLAALLEAVPCDCPELEDRDEWIKFLTAVKAACGGDDEFYEQYVYPWCSVVDGNDEEYVRERWESFNDSALGWSYLVSVAQAYGFGGQLFDDVDWSALDDDKAANTRPVAGLLPDEAVIADQFVNAHAQKRWITVKRDAKPEWYKSVNGLWERDDLTIEYDVSQRCREVAKILRRGPFASATEAKAANTRAQALNGAVMAQHVARLVRNDPRMHVEASQLDEHAWLLGYEGGYVARDGTLMPPDASLYFTKHLRFAPDYKAACPKFDAMLGYLTRGDEEEQEAILRWFGYCLSGTGQEQKFFFFRGGGGSGITTLLEIFKRVCGTYGRTVDHKAFMTGASERFGPAMLARVWAVVTSENDQSGQWSDTMLKTATGSGSMEIEEKNRDHRDININFGISFQGNRVPSLGRVDAAMRRRMVLAEYMMKREEDGLPVKLGYAQDLVNEEGPAILGRILQARARYDKDGLIIMPRWKRATDEYFASIDVKGLFFDDELRFGQLLSVSTVILYDRYVQWHRDSGYKTPPGSIHAFIRELKEHPKIREHGVIFKREVVEGRKIHMAYGMGCLEVNSNVDFPKISL